MRFGLLQYDVHTARVYCLLTPYCSNHRHILINMSASQSYWYIGFVSLGGDSGGETQLYCRSVETAVRVNPGDASWNCKYR